MCSHDQFLLCTGQSPVALVFVLPAPMQCRFSHIVAKFTSREGANTRTTPKPPSALILSVHQKRRVGRPKRRRREAAAAPPTLPDDVSRAPAPPPHSSSSSAAASPNRYARARLRHFPSHHVRKQRTAGHRWITKHECIAHSSAVIFHSHVGITCVLYNCWACILPVTVVLQRTSIQHANMPCIRKLRVIAGKSSGSNCWSNATPTQRLQNRSTSHLIYEKSVYK